MAKGEERNKVQTAIDAGGDMGNAVYCPIIITDFQENRYFHSENEGKEKRIRAHASRGRGKKKTEKLWGIYC
jgi:hypothetical protein